MTWTPQQTRQARRAMQDIVEQFGPAIENDEPISGCDAVDYLVELYRVAKELTS